MNKERIEKYKRLKRKYRELVEESHFLAEELIRAHRHSKRVQIERDFLIEKIAKMDEKKAIESAQEAKAAIEKAEAEEMEAMVTAAAAKSMTTTKKMNSSVCCQYEISPGIRCSNPASKLSDRL